MKVLLALLFFSLPTYAQYAHRSNPGDRKGTPQTITAAGSATTCPGTGCVIVNAEGAKSAFVTISAVTGGTYDFRCSNDGWVTTKNVLAYPYAATTGIVSVNSVASTTTAGDWILALPSCREFAVYASAAGTSATVRIDVDPISTAPLLTTNTSIMAFDDPTASPQIFTLIGGTSVGAGGTGVAATVKNTNVPTLGDTSLVVSRSPVGDPCGSNAVKSSAVINISSATTTQLVALSGSTSIYVCGFVLTNTGATTTTTATFEYGTGASCGTGTTVLTGAMGQSLLTSAIVVVATGGVQFTAPSGKALCLLSAGTTPSIQGYVTYVQQQ